MLCPKCNNEVNEGNFCTKCGTNLANNMPNNNGRTTKLIVTREKSFIGCLINFPVYINDNLLGDLKNGESLSCDLGVGNYTVTFSMFEKKVSQDITVNGNNNCIEITCVASMGFLTAVAKIKNVTYK